MGTRKQRERQEPVWFGAAELGTQDLDGDVAAECRVLRAIDDPHPAFGELVRDGTTTDRSADEGHGNWPSV